MKTVKNFAKSFILAVSQGSEYCSAGACLKEGTKVSESTYGDLLRGSSVNGLGRKRSIFSGRTFMSETIFGNWKPFTNDEKWFLFHFKSYFRSQNISVFVLTFWPCIKQPDQKDKVNFKFYDVITWLTNNCNTDIEQ